MMKDSIIHYRGRWENMLGVFFLDVIGLLTGLFAEREYLRDGKLTKMIVLAILVFEFIY
jgi:hypothetical protein